MQARDISGGVHFHPHQAPATPAPRQLPGDVRGFVNRVDELERLDELLTDRDQDPYASALLIIAGTAGAGKTSLALHWAHRVRERFLAGELYVNLRGYDPGVPVTPDEALARFLRALDVAPGTIPEDTEAKATLFRTLVADRQMLIVLDNASTVRQIRPLLPGTASCLVLVTSRSRLSGLVARDGAQRITLGILPPAEAVELLRKVTAKYRKQDTERELSELAQLCAYLPLALRIAAERAASRPQMPLRDLIRDLRDESGLWDALSADDEEEADAVRTVFAWSYRALSQDAARLFRLLGLHPGPQVSAEAAAALTGQELGQTRHLLDVLVGAHLLEQTDRDRYQFHDLLRAYSSDQTHHLETLQDRRAALDRLFTWYLHTADRVAAVLYTPWARIQLATLAAGVRPLDLHTYDESLRWYETEQENLAAVTDFAIAQGRNDIGWQLPAVLRQIYADHNPAGDWFALGSIGLDAARRVESRYGQALILEALSRAQRHTGRLDEALKTHAAALALWRHLADRSGEARSINNFGLTYTTMRRLTEARAQFTLAVQIAIEIGDGTHTGVARMNLGRVLELQGDYPRSLEVLGQAQSELQQANRKLQETRCLAYIAYAKCALGQLDEALACCEAALTITRELRNPVFEADHLLIYGRIQRAFGRQADALASYQRAAVVHERTGDGNAHAKALDAIGATYREMGQPEQAIDFHRRAVTLLRTTEHQWRLAVSLNHLAMALDLIGDRNAAISCWREAHPLIENISDPLAVELRHSIEGQLETGQSQ